MEKNQRKMTPAKGDHNNDEMVFSWANYKWMLAGVIVVVLGFVLMAGGGSNDANVFDAERLFAWRRIGLAPIVVLVGFGIVGYSIMRRPKGEKSDK